jgi:hypothetical protein
MKLNITAFALAFGIWWGVGLFIMTWWLIFLGAVPSEIGIFHELYPGYAMTPIGSFVGLIWGFICGGICGAILAWLYNTLADRVGRR